MNYTKPFVLSALAFLAGAISFILSGCSTAVPTKLESKFFDFHTNYVEVMSIRTNVIPVTIYETNVVAQTITNEVGVQVTRTNISIVPVTVNQTNTTLVTNQVPDGILYTPNANARAVTETGAAAGGLFGFGGLVGTGLGALFSVWGMLRSKKNLVTAGAIAQNVETMREFIRRLPNGLTYDAALVQWMQQHQAEQGVVKNVIDLLASNLVSNGDAQVTAIHIKAAIDALNTPAVPPVPATVIVKAD